MQHIRACLFLVCLMSLKMQSDVRSYLCSSLPVEHRPSTTPHHRTLFWAALVIPVQLVPCCFSSAVSHLQLLRGWPLFLFPCGFQVRAWRVVLDAGFLRVCLIQSHFLHSICLATGSCPRNGSAQNSLTCCHTETEVVGQTCYLTQPQYAVSRPFGPSTDPAMPDAW